MVSAIAHVADNNVTQLSDGERLNDIRQHVDVMIEDEEEAYERLAEDSYASRNEARDYIRFLNELRSELISVEPSGRIDLSKTVVDYGYDEEAAESDRSCGIDYVSEVDRERDVHEEHIGNVEIILVHLLQIGITADTSFNTIMPD